MPNKQNSSRCYCFPNHLKSVLNEKLKNKIDVHKINVIINVLSQQKILVFDTVLISGMLVKLQFQTNNTVIPGAVFPVL